MKATSRPALFGRMFAAVSFALAAATHAASQKPPTEERYSTNIEDRAACELQLNRIYGAIETYRSRHENEYPEKLSDLPPDILHDRNLLICPYIRALGGLRAWRKSSRELGPDGDTSYSYELSPEPVNISHWRGLPKKTWQDIKLAVAKELGPVVPIVRCHFHRPRLNLAISGRIYPSEMYWEKEFTTNEYLLSVGLLFPTNAPQVTAANFPPRDPRSPPQLIDLTTFYNATLTNSWQGFPGNNLAGLPSGIQEFDRVRFDVRGVIQLGSRDLPAPFPKKVEGIKVNEKCRLIHFLHAASFQYKTGFTNGFYIVHYADDQAHEIPLIYGQQIADWWRNRTSKSAPTAAKRVWAGENEAATAYDKVICLYRYTWENPRPDTPIRNITFDSGPKAGAPFVVALTLE